MIAYMSDLLSTRSRCLLSLNAVDTGPVDRTCSVLHRIAREYLWDGRPHETLRKMADEDTTVSFVVEYGSG
jgi:hypothetical protein